MSRRLRHPIFKSQGDRIVDADDEILEQTGSSIPAFIDRMGQWKKKEDKKENE